MERAYLAPAEIAARYIEIGYNKANQPWYRLLLLGILAGAFIAFAAEGSNVAIHTVSSVGLGKALAGALFATGLMMVVITGAELFTGNTLILVSCMEKKARWAAMLRNWVLVYLGNFIGSMLIVFFILKSGQLNFSQGLLGGFSIKLAAYKTGLDFSEAFFLGIMCNWLVCLAVWMASAAKDIAGKMLAIFFPIWLFITSGFEHSIANMYYIPIGILAKSNPAWVAEALTLGATIEQLNMLHWGGFLKNIVPVTLGNIVGGSFFVGMMYWLSFLYKGKNIKTQNKNQRSGGKTNAA
ncbi:MAG: formate/nitrite transporter family protein [Peptococcaceae bacterium]|mgnify:FL=1|nr:formate/nitrite transporter family protein [Peptococcaceae bacterium]